MAENNRKMLKVKCANRGLFGDVAMTVGDFAIGKGVPFLGIRALRWAAIMLLNPHATRNYRKKPATMSWKRLDLQ